MRNKPVVPILLVSLLFLPMVGCTSSGSSRKTARFTGASMVARYTPSRVIIDGWLDEMMWREAKAYPLGLARDRAGRNNHVEEEGVIRLAWDDRYLYVAVDFKDSDVVAEGLTDQLPHFQLGDVCEVFLKPENQSWYWELYVTPLSRKSNFFFPGSGRFGLQSNFQYDCGMRVSAKFEGTINNWQDKDKRWTAEMAIPIRDLRANGETFGPGSDWRILVARYNYSRYRTQRGPELTMVPTLSETNFHLLDEYIPLRLIR